MPFDYEKDPLKIEQQSFQTIRAETDLSGFDKLQQQVAMRVVHSAGLPETAQSLRFSANACVAGTEALKKQVPILCDVEMVKQGVTKRFIDTMPLCFLNSDEAADMAKRDGTTRSMAALELWRPYLSDSIVLIANAPTALFRLLEMLEAGCDKPALIIGMPVGFIGAAESKQALWDVHEKLGLECITLLGRQGGSAITAGALNALLRCIHGEFY